jgi:hypothetical protein
MGESKYSSTHFEIRHQMDLSGQRHIPLALSALKDTQLVPILEVAEWDPKLVETF